MAGKICAADKPVMNCPAEAPSARVTAAACRESWTVAQVVKMTFTAARAMSMTVMSRRTRFSRAVWEMKPTSDRPGSAVPAGPDGETVKVAWAKSTATIPLTVTAMLRPLSRTRRGRREARRRASRRGTGRRAEQAMSRACRRGGRAASARASTVLVRAARTAGM
jgi:hypothetical protein